MSDKVKIGISRCLTGQRVRYDGKIETFEPLKRLKEEFDLVDICPEIGIGLPVPREPIDLFLINGEIRLFGLTTNIELTEKMNAYCEDQVAGFVKANIAGFVLRHRSPSCGLKDANLHLADGVIEERGRGLFAAKLLEELPGLPVVEARDLKSKDSIDAFIRDVKDY